MTHLANALYSPYGAYELKAKYQSNLLTATLITVSSVALILLGTWIAARFAPKASPVLDPGPTVIASFKLIPVPPTILPRPEIDVSAQVVAPPTGGIPTPVEDDAILDENVLLPTQEEISRRIDFDGSGLPGDGREFVFDIEPEDVIPALYEFQFMEIQPEMIYGNQPTYPRLARSVGITGVVALRVLVNEAGGVDSAIVEVSSHTTSLDEAAIEAAYKNKFKPGIQNGRPVKCWVSYKVRFDLD